MHANAATIILYCMHLCVLVLDVAVLWQGSGEGKHNSSRSPCFEVDTRLLYCSDG